MLFRKTKPRELILAIASAAAALAILFQPIETYQMAIAMFVFVVIYFMGQNA